MAFTWQNIHLDPGMSVERSFIVQFGGFETSVLTLWLEFPSLEAPRKYDAEISITGLAGASPPPSRSDITLIVVVDGAATAPKVIPELYRLDQPFALRFVPSNFGIPDGRHTLDFYGLTYDGDISDVHRRTVTLEGPTPAATPTPLRTASGLAAAGLSDTAVIGATVGSVLAVAVVVGVVAVYCVIHKPQHEKLDPAAAEREEELAA
jgi:hypothetical protein